MSYENQGEENCSRQVEVPATSANLGCAFDCGGLALKLTLKAIYSPSRSSSGLTMEYRGRDPERIPLDDSNLVLSSFRYACSHLGKTAPQGHIQVESDIPVGVGLGSSAAAAIAGLVLGSRFCSEQVSAEQILGWAENIEGHIDNAAAAYHGGLVFALCNNTDHIVTLKTDFPEHIRLVVVSPSVTVPTHEARRVLPNAYERADVCIRCSGRHYSRQPAFQENSICFRSCSTTACISRIAGNWSRELRKLCNSAMRVF